MRSHSQSPAEPASVFDAALRQRVMQARDTAVAALLQERNARGHWTGELSASALSTTTAVVALTLAARGDRSAEARLRPLIERGFAWLIAHQNSDGGWGDTVRSNSNISTTTMAWAAFALETAPTTPPAAAAVRAAELWIRQAAGSIEPIQLVAAIERRYGDDRTFSIPILTLCALCGRLGSGRDGWRHVRALPFELAALPQAWFGALRLPVVSYALPALIAIGQVRHGLGPLANPLSHALRERCRARTLQKLAELQPANGGFLEATPLTSFVTMSVAALGLTAHPVVQRGVAFIGASARPDGSWPIDTNLATWVTTLSVNALTAAEPAAHALSADERARIAEWLLGQQNRVTHPYTLAAPGGWAWTDLPGGVPDADDTPGAILALLQLDPERTKTREPIEAAVTWLLDLQNRDGGIPTFCRGWGKLPFDRSSPDLTAHALRAWSGSRDHVSAATRLRIERAHIRALQFLRSTQRPDGSWAPLWFGHQDHPAEENPVYGTSRVALALAELAIRDGQVCEPLRAALQWLLRQQRPDGGWSSAPNGDASVEETGLALEALAQAWEVQGGAAPDELARSLRAGAAWIAESVERENWRTATPIGFYFAKLWYFERLYPLIYATSALTRLAGIFGSSKCD